MTADFIGIHEQTGKIAKDHRLTIAGEDWRGVRLVRVTVHSSDSCEDVKHLYLRAPAAVAAGHAMINVAARQPIDYTCEQWIRGVPLPGGDWLDRVREELVSPRATSEGHKNTIYAARLLMDELDRMRVAATKGGAS